MTLRSGLTFTSVVVAVALALSACGGSGTNSGAGVDDDGLRIETSAETETSDLSSTDDGVDDEVDAPESTGDPDNSDNLALDGSDSADGDGTNQAGPLGSGDSSVVLAGTTYEYTLMCAREPGEVGLAVSGVAATGPLYGGFDADGPVDSLSVAVDGEPWRAESSDGNYGEFISLDVDFDAGTATGTAVFEAETGETAEGSFTLICSNL